MANDYVTRFRADTSQHDAAIKSSTSYIKSFDSSIKKTQKSLDGMKGKFSSLGGELGRMGFDKLKGSLGSLGDILMNNVAGSLGKVTVMSGSTSAGILGLSAAASSALPILAGVAGSIAVISKSAKFEVNLDNLQALTGLDDSKMKDVANSAIEMSGKFGIAAGDIVDSMALIGSQFPALLKDSKALGEVTEAANVLSKAGGLAVEDAAKGITTVLNQMGVAASESMDIINVLAAGSQQGAADIEYLNKALEKSGTAFNSAGMGYVEAIAAIETVAPKFSSADVAGSQLNSTLLKLSTQANNNFKPSVVGMSQALENLANAELTDLELKQLVGESNVTMIKTLIEQKDLYNGLSESLDGTNTAFEQMGIRMDNIPAIAKRLRETWNGFLLSMGQSQIFQDIQKVIKGFLNSLIGLLNGMSQIVKPIMSVFDSLWSVTKSLISVFTPLRETATITNKAFSGLVSILRFLANIISEVSSVYVFFINKVSSGLAKLWNNMKAIFTNSSVFQWFRNQLTKVVEWWDKVVGFIEKKWKAFKKWIGMETDKFESTETISIENEKPKDLILDDIAIGVTPILSDDTKKEIQEGTIDWYEEAIKGIDKELKGTLVSEERLTELLAKKAEYAEKLLELQTAYGLVQKRTETTTSASSASIDSPINPNSYKGISDALSSLNEQLDLEVYGSDKYWELVKSIKELTQKKLEIEVQIDNDLLSDSDKKIRSIKEGLELSEKIGSDMSSVFSSLGGIFSEFGNKGSDANSKIFQTLGLVSNAIAEMIPHIMTIITAKQAEAIASGSASAAKLPYPANIPAILSIVGVLGSLFASLPKFSGGGIFKGATGIGDYNLAKVNSGEMILNGTQQSKLFHILSTSGYMDSDLQPAEVTFRIEGDTLIGLLNNHNRKHRRIK